MTSEAAYQVVLLGAADARATAVRAAVLARAGDLGLPHDAFAFLDGAGAPGRDRKLSTMGIFFGSTAAGTDEAAVRDLIEDSVVIAPVVSALARVDAELPPQLRHVNALECPERGDPARLVSLVFETFLLLRRERKLFISYRRADSQALANRLYDALDSRQFDVFIDVRTVPPAADFQSELWHRMSDSDVVVLIDTPGFRSSRWTVEELARANSTNIQILHLLWPGQREEGVSSFSHFHQLHPADFGGSGPGDGADITAQAIDRICSEVERLRARAMAARHRYLVDNFCDIARDLGLAPSVQTERWISVPSPKGDLAVVPAVGVPDSRRIHAIFDARSAGGRAPRHLWIIYDNRGILQTFLAHLDWLDSHLPIRAVRMTEVEARLEEHRR